MTKRFGIKNFLKYLKTKKWKIVYYLFILGVAIGAYSEVFMYWGIYSLGVDLAICLGIAAIVFGAAYHPYYEWKDGILKKEQQDAYKDSLK